MNRNLTLEKETDIDITGRVGKPWGMKERKFNMRTHQRRSLRVLSNGLVKVDVGMVPYLKRRARIHVY